MIPPSLSPFHASPLDPCRKWYHTSVSSKIPFCHHIEIPLGGEDLVSLLSWLKIKKFVFVGCFVSLLLWSLVRAVAMRELSRGVECHAGWRMSVVLFLIHDHHGLVSWCAQTSGVLES